MVDAEVPQEGHGQRVEVEEAADEGVEGVDDGGAVPGAEEGAHRVDVVVEDHLGDEERVGESDDLAHAQEPVHAGGAVSVNEKNEFTISRNLCTVIMKLSNMPSLQYKKILYLAHLDTDPR